MPYSRTLRPANKAVVGQLFVIGKTNRFIAELLTHGLPTKSGDEVSDPSQMINVADALTNTVAVLHLRGIADDAAVHRNGDVVRPPRIRPVVGRSVRRVPAHPRQQFPAAAAAQRSGRFAARWTKTISVDTGPAL